MGHVESCARAKIHFLELVMISFSTSQHGYHMKKVVQINARRVFIEIPGLVHYCVLLANLDTHAQLCMHASKSFPLPPLGLPRHSYLPHSFC